MEHKILMSVDMDEWYQCRWATGSRYAIWPDIQTFFLEYYGTDEPIGEIIPLSEKILKLFDENDIKATFFFTGVIADYYSDLVKEISREGHEIASHNFVHKDYDRSNPEEFLNDLEKSKILLEKLSGEKVIGYRAPNSTISNYMIRDLKSLGFLYDSSVTPTKPFMGKFGNFSDSPINPYQLAIDNFSFPGDSGVWEFPWPVFPYGKLPAGSGIMTRIAGYHYTIISLDYALKTGDTVYYFHPYEIGKYPLLKGLNFKTKLFMKNLGDEYHETLKKLINKYRGKYTNGRDLIEKQSQIRRSPL